MKIIQKILAGMAAAVMTAVQIPLLYVSAGGNLSENLMEHCGNEYLPASEVDINQEPESKDLVSYWLSYTGVGIAITCDDTDALIAQAEDEHPLIWKDAYWSSYYFIDNSKQDDFLIQPIEGFAAEAGQYMYYERYSTEKSQVTCEISEDFYASGKRVFLLSCAKGKETDLIRFVERASGIEILGAAQWASYNEMYYDNTDSDMCTSSFYIKYKDGTDEFGSQPRGLSLDEALAKCSEMEAADDRIDYVCLTGTALDLLRDVNSVLRLVPYEYRLPQKGDINNDGKVSAYDAQLVLNNTLDLMLGNETEPLAGADIDGNGAVTSLDAQYILQFYLRNDVLEEMTMWRDILPA